MNLQPIKVRSAVLVGVLSTLTLGLYNVYLMWAWTREVNGLVREERYNPTLVLLAGVATCGLSGCVFEMLFARDLEMQAHAAGRELLMKSFGTVILVLNVAGLMLDLTVVGALVGFPLGVAASVLMQRELNEWSRRFTTAASATAS
jgi:hypothetical protein